jgi:transcriptional regulator with XRE-family HTH domain
MARAVPPHTLLKRWRESKNLTQAEAARQLGVSAPTWLDLERGTKLPGLSIARALQDKTGIDRELWDDLDQKRRDERKGAQ